MTDEDFEIMQQRVEFLRSNLERVTRDKAALTVELRRARRALSHIKPGPAGHAEAIRRALMPDRADECHAPCCDLGGYLM